MTWNAYDMEFDAYGYDDKPEEYDADGPAECLGCYEIFPESALYGSGLCADCENNRDDDDDYIDYADDVLRYEGDYHD